MRSAWARISRHLSGLVSRLFAIEDTPHAIAGGVAIGMFMGFTPLFGLKTLLCIAAATALRCNPIAAVVAVCLHDLITPLWPVLLRLEYDAGHFILSHPHRLPEKLSAGQLHPLELLHWTTFLGVGFPLLVGSLVFAAPAAAIAYALTYRIVTRRRNRLRERASADAESD